ncbi:MAG: nucleotidyl transferase AbiEii/AbiGii toxin family protein [Endomicrobia bacterium]|nr:nucleotidyl transferase AbiEii/AbiGii toxin family protein [Endomicrobiia bacterium]
MLHFKDGDILKIDFNYYPFPRIEKGIKYKNIQVDSILDIAANKIHTIFMQPRVRDFVDIYFIIKEKNYSLEDLIIKAKTKFDWQIEPVELGKRLLQAAELADYPRMVKKLNHNEWKQLFLKRSKKT